MKYVKPEMELQELELKDVICASIEDDDSDGDGSSGSGSWAQP